MRLDIIEAMKKVEAERSNAREARRAKRHTVAERMELARTIYKDEAIFHGLLTAYLAIDGKFPPEDYESSHVLTEIQAELSKGVPFENALNAAIRTWIR